MNIVRKAHCRTFQFCFKAALPILPYREPKILEDMREAAKKLVQKKIRRVLIVTDKGIVQAGLLFYL